MSNNPRNIREATVNAFTSVDTQQYGLAPYVRFSRGFSRILHSVTQLIERYELVTICLSLGNENINVAPPRLFLDPKYSKLAKFNILILFQL